MGKKKKSGVRLNSKASRSKKKFEPMKVSPSPVEKDKQLPEQHMSSNIEETNMDTNESLNTNYRNKKRLSSTESSDGVDPLSPKIRKDNQTASSSQNKSESSNSNGNNPTASMEDLRINENSHDDRSEAMDIDEVSPSPVEKDTQLPGQQKTKKTPIKPIKITYKHINEIYKLLTKPEHIKKYNNINNKDTFKVKVLKILLMNIQLLKHESFDKNLREELEKLLEDNFNILNTSEIYIENNKGNSQITIDNNKSLFNSPLGKKCLIISQIFTKSELQ